MSDYVDDDRIGTVRLGDALLGRAEGLTALTASEVEALPNTGTMCGYAALNSVRTNGAGASGDGQVIFGKMTYEVGFDGIMDGNLNGDYDEGTNTSAYTASIDVTSIDGRFLQDDDGLIASARSAYSAA